MFFSGKLLNISEDTDRPVRPQAWPGTRFRPAASWEGLVRLESLVLGGQEGPGFQSNLASEPELVGCWPKNPFWPKKSDLVD